MIQAFKATREIVTPVDAMDLESAIEKVESGSLDTPLFDHPDWRTQWDLRNKEVEKA